MPLRGRRPYLYVFRSPFQRRQIGLAVVSNMDVPVKIWMCMLMRFE
jgi:hypothetical protein